MKTPVQRAYRDAWDVRQQTGDRSHALLLNHLREADAPPEFFEPGGEVHNWVLDCWDRGVSPARLTLEASRKMLELIPGAFITPLRAILRNLR